MRTLLLDLQYAFRQILKSPAFAVTSISMLAFGIGATTAIYSVVEAVLLRPLPFPDSSRVVILGDRITGIDIPEGTMTGVTVPDIRAYTRDAHAFSALGGYQRVSFELSGLGEPAQIDGARLTGGVFPALGVQPMLGRVFTQDEDDHHQQVTVLSYATWVGRFQSNPHVLGTKILLERKPYIVIGVMPREFEFPLVRGQINRCELWVPMSFQPAELLPVAAAYWGYSIVGRLKPGISIQQAQTDAEAVAQAMGHNLPPMFANLHITPAIRRLQEQITIDARPVLRTLFFAVAVVLLIACANLAGLMLVRAIRRQRDVAIRLALGARALAMLRQGIVECLVLSVSGGVVGLAAAAILMRVGTAFLPESLPRIAEISFNWNIVGFALCLAVLTGILCGLVPALAALRTDVNSNLKEGGRTGSAGAGQGRLRSALVVVEIAVALVLLTASGLLLRSFEKMRAVDLGFRPDHATIAAYALPQKQYVHQSQIDAFTRQVLERLEQTPGVTAAAITTTLPAVGAYGYQNFQVENYTPPPGANLNLATVSEILGNFFPATGMRLLRGRAFTPDDRQGSQPVVVVNHKLAQHYWPGQDAIGKHLRLGTSAMPTPWMTVVGVVADVQLSSPDTPTREQYYTPLGQVDDDWGSAAPPDDLNGNAGYIVLRSAQPAEQMENTLTATVHAVDPLLPLTELQTMEQAVSSSEAPRRFNTALISGFAIAAVILAILGIYSVIAFSVASREQEMAIRMALGSSRRAILQLVLVSGAKLAALGCVVGLAGALFASGLLQTLLFGVSRFDPLVLTLAAGALLLLSVAASILPALRAASVDPILAQRGE
ncbi:MAG TPA: ABC transporter permease [Terracidiphilus sp.]|jgi:putative ABC transport system permease protein|nr:ABC transporter permease [Terracidiphilus sp.]